MTTKSCGPTAVLIDDLLDALCVGKENAIPAAELEGAVFGNLTHTSVRIRELARAANLLGHPVISCDRGFFLACEWEEIRAYEQSLIGRAQAILERARALSKVRPVYQ